MKKQRAKPVKQIDLMELKADIIRHMNEWMDEMRNSISFVSINERKTHKEFEDLSKRVAVLENIIKVPNAIRLAEIKSGIDILARFLNEIQEKV